MKHMWYYRPRDFKSTNKQPKSIDYIRSKYGSDQVSTDFKEKAIKSEEEKV